MRKLLTGLTLFFIAGNILAGIKGTVYRDMKAVQIENEILKVVVLPQRGANISSIVYKPTGREWMWNNPNPYKLPPYAASFVEYDISGFDDMFPTVGPCRYPDGAWKRIEMPDHGEVWALPWDYKIDKNSVKFWVYGMRLPYLLEKTIILSKNTVKISYKVTNFAPEPMKAFWAAHSLVAVESGMEMIYPADTVLKGDSSPWTPAIKGKIMSIALGDASTKIARKLFTEKVSAGWSGFYNQKSKEFLVYEYPKDKIPYIGIWINQGGFPSGEWHYNVGIEPASCGAETIEIGNKENVLVPIPAKGTFEWYFNITAGKANSIYEIPIK